MQQLGNCFFSIFQGASSTATKGRETLYQAGFVRKRLDPEVTTALKIHRVSPNVKISFKYRPTTKTTANLSNQHKKQESLICESLL